MEYVSSDMKLLPYGMMNFEDIRLDNYNNSRKPQGHMDIHRSGM